MSRRSPTRFLWVLLLAIPAVFLYFGVNSLLYRVDARAQAVEMTAKIEHVRRETYSCKDSDGHTRTCERVAYDLTIDVSGDRMRRPLVEGNFDPDAIWHSADMINPEDYPVGAPMAVLVRPDLGYVVVIDAFWSAYVLPIVLLVFGAFWLVGLSVIVPSIIRKGG